METGEVVKRIVDGTIRLDDALSFIEARARLCTSGGLGEMLVELVRGVDDLSKRELQHFGRLILSSRESTSDDYRSSIYYDFSVGMTTPLYALLSYALPDQPWVVVCAALYAICMVERDKQAILEQLITLRRISKGPLTDSELLLVRDLGIVLISDEAAAQRRAIREKLKLKQ